MKKGVGSLGDKENIVASSLSMVLEDSQGKSSIYPFNLALKNLLDREVALFLETDFDCSRTYFELKEGPKRLLLGGAKDWDGFHYYLSKLNKARKALHSLQSWYESTLKANFQTWPLSNRVSQVFFNSHLIYLIALIDDNEDNLGHSQFVAAYALLLAKAMGIEDENFLLDLQRGALLHDIGKIGIPESILCKADRLTPLEREIIKEHPLLGYLILQEYPFFQGASEIVLYHHEWFDGQGYPFGLIGEEIPLAARIFSLADTLDAILSDRPYRRGRDFKAAVKEIEKGSGSQFDPAIVDIFLSIPEKKWQQVRSQAISLFRLPLVH